MGAQDYNVIVGQQVQVARNSTGLSENDVAQRMNNLGFSSWSAQTVSDAELGVYHLAAAEVLGISLALGVSLAYLVSPTGGDEWVVQLAGGQIVPLRGFAPIGWANNAPVEIPPPYAKTRHY